MYIFLVNPPSLVELRPLFGEGLLALVDAVPEPHPARLERAAAGGPVVDLARPVLPQLGVQAVRLALAVLQPLGGLVLRRLGRGRIRAIAVRARKETSHSGMKVFTGEICGKKRQKEKSASYLPFQALKSFKLP